MTKSRKVDIGKGLVIGAASYQAYQFGRALYVYDPAGWQILGVNLGGIALGVIVNVMVALAAARLPAVKGKIRVPAVWCAFVALLLLSPSLVAPGMYLLLENLMVSDAWRQFLSFGLAAAPDLAIALGGFIAGKALVPLLSDSQAKPSKPLSEGKRVARGRSAKKSKSLEVVQCRYAGAGCELSGTQNAMNAHSGFCKFKPIAIMTADAMRKA